MRKDWHDVVLHYLSLARSGEKADVELAANIAVLKSDQVFPIAELYLGKMTPEDVLKVADTPDRVCAVKFYTGEWHYLKGQTAEAITVLKSVLANCNQNEVEYSLAKAELKRWEKN